MQVNTLPRGHIFVFNGKIIPLAFEDKIVLTTKGELISAAHLHGYERTLGLFLKRIQYNRDAELHIRDILITHRDGYVYLGDTYIDSATFLQAFM